MEEYELCCDSGSLWSRLVESKVRCLVMFAFRAWSTLSSVTEPRETGQWLDGSTLSFNACGACSRSEGAHSEEMICRCYPLDQLPRRSLWEHGDSEATDHIGSGKGPAQLPARQSSMWPCTLLKD